MVDAKGASLGVKPKARSLHPSGCAVKNSNAPNRSGRASSCCLLGCLELRAAAIGPHVQFLLKRPQSEDAILQSDSTSTGHVAPWFLPVVGFNADLFAQGFGKKSYVPHVDKFCPCLRRR